MSDRKICFVILKIWKIGNFEPWLEFSSFGGAENYFDVDRFRRKNVAEAIARAHRDEIGQI